MTKLAVMTKNPVDSRQDNDTSSDQNYPHQHEMLTLGEVINTARIRELERAATLLSEGGHTQLAESLREWTKRLNRALGTEEIPPEVWIG